MTGGTTVRFKQMLDTFDKQSQTKRLGYQASSPLPHLQC